MFTDNFIYHIDFTMFVIKDNGKILKKKTGNIDCIDTYNNTVILQNQ